MSSETEDTPSYSSGTAAGHKGRSKKAREIGREAAASVTADLPRRHRQMVEAWMPYGAVGAIPEEIANDLGLPVHVIRPRCGELVTRGLFFELDKRPGLLGSNVTAYSVVSPADTDEAA